MASVKKPTGSGEKHQAYVLAMDAALEMEEKAGAQSLQDDNDDEDPSESSSSPSSESEENAPRTLYLRHFTKALKEISPSSSESLGTLAALRKWNEEFGEGQKKKVRRMWGKGVVGFSGPDVEVMPDGRVSGP